MKITKLPNGLTVITEKKPLNSITIEVAVKVGSNDESKELFGISHFVEHMLFEGTKKRTANEIANQIESKGGDINAATAHDRTMYSIKIPNKHANLALDVLSDLIHNPVFDEKKIEKERQVILSEVDLVMDEPTYYQWFFFLNNLYQKHPTKNPIYGTRKTVSKLKRKDMVEFHNKYYSPQNMIISIVGDTTRITQKIKKYFNFKKRPLARKIQINEPKQTKPKQKTEKRPVNQSYLILGYKTVPRNHKHAYVLDVIKAVLGRGQSGKLFNEIRTKRGLGYDVGAEHEPSIDHGFFATHVSTDKKNISEVKSIILTEIKNLQNLTEKELKQAKTFLEGEFILNSEDSQKLANLMNFWQLSKDAKLINTYIKKIKKVTINDIKQVVDIYFKNHTTTIIQQK